MQYKIRNNIYIYIYILSYTRPTWTPTPPKVHPRLRARAPVFSNEFIPFFSFIALAHAHAHANARTHAGRAAAGGPAKHTYITHTLHTHTHTPAGPCTTAPPRCCGTSAPSRPSPPPYPPPAACAGAHAFMHAYTQACLRARTLGSHGHLGTHATHASTHVGTQPTHTRIDDYDDCVDYTAVLLITMHV
jgi:hypothetical protein